MNGAGAAVLRSCRGKGVRGGGEEGRRTRYSRESKNRARKDNEEIENLTVICTEILKEISIQSFKTVVGIHSEIIDTSVRYIYR